MLDQFAKKGWKVFAIESGVEMCKMCMYALFLYIIYTTNIRIGWCKK